MFLEFSGIFLWKIFGTWNVDGIDLFVKILVFVKILSESKEGGKFQSLEVRVQAYRT